MSAALPGVSTAFMNMSAALTSLSAALMRVNDAEAVCMQTNVQGGREGGRGEMHHLVDYSPLCVCMYMIMALF